MAEMHNFYNETKSMQIKGDKPLAELTESVQHMSNKVNNFENNRKEKEEIINSLKEEVSTLYDRVWTLEKKAMTRNSIQEGTAY